MLAKLKTTSTIGFVAALMTFVEALIFNGIYPRDKLAGAEYALFITVNLFIAGALFALIKRLKSGSELTKDQQRKGEVS